MPYKKVLIWLTGVSNACGLFFTVKCQWTVDVKSELNWFNNVCVPVYQLVKITLDPDLFMLLTFCDMLKL